MQQVQKDFIFFCGMLFIFTLLKFRKENIYETFLNGDKFRTRKERIVAYTMCKYIFEMVSEICPGCLCYCSAAHFIYFHYSFVDESLKSVQNRKILGGWVLDLFNVYNANGIANGYRDDVSFCPVY